MRCPKKLAPLPSEQGSALITIMMILSLLLILSSLVTQMASNGLRAIDRISTSRSVEDLRNFLRSKVDCPRTIARLSPNSESILLYGRNDAPIAPVNGSGHTINDWTIKVLRYDPTTGNMTIVATNARAGLSNVPLFTTAPFTCGRS